MFVSRSREGEGGRGSVEVVTGWKQLKKGLGKERKEATGMEKEDMDRSLPARRRDRGAVKGPASMTKEFLDDAISQGRFQWPPKEYIPPNVTEDCARCKRLKLEECLCVDIDDARMHPSGVKRDGGDSVADSIVQLMESEMEDSTVPNATVARESGWGEVKETHYVYDDDTCTLTVINNPLDPPLRKRLNETGDMPQLSPPGSWPYCRSQWDHLDYREDEDWFPVVKPGLPDAPVQPRLVPLSEYHAVDGSASIGEIAKVLVTHSAVQFTAGDYSLDGTPIREWDAKPSSSTPLVLNAPPDPTPESGSTESKQTGAYLVYGKDRPSIHGQWILSGHGSGQLEGMDCGWRPRTSDLKCTPNPSQDGAGLEDVDMDEDPALKKLLAKQEKLWEKDMSLEEGWFAVVAVVGGNWSLYSCEILADAKADCLRTSKRAQVSAAWCYVGGFDNETRAGNALTALHKSRVSLEWCNITFTSASAIRALNTARAALSYCQIHEVGQYGLDIAQDAHLALRHVEFHGYDDGAIEESRICYTDSPPLYFPSRHCDWCPRWCPSFLPMVPTVEDAMAEKDLIGSAADAEGGKTPTMPWFGSTILQGLTTLDDADAIEEEDSEEGAAPTRVTAKAPYQIWCYEDPSLKGQTFANGKQMQYPMSASGARYGSILGTMRPWCPPEYIRRIRADFPNGICDRDTDGVLKHAAVKELFADGASVQAMVDSGIKLSDLQGLELMEEENVDDDDDKAALDW